MRTLCPTCGIATTHRWSPLPPRCASCRQRLPLRMSRQFTYIARSAWKPAIFLAILIVFLLFSPRVEPYRTALKHIFFNELI